MSRKLLGDTVLGLVLVAAVVAESWPRWGQVIAGIVWSGLVVGSGRRWPGWALLIGVAANLLYLAELTESQVWPVTVSAVAGALAGRRMADTATAAAVFSGVGLAGLPVAAMSGEVWLWVNVMGSLLFFGVLPWLVGRYLRLRALLATAGWQRAEQLEREQLLVAREARLRERTRIARDMHDSLGHDLALIAMRAGALELDRDLAGRHRETIGELRAASVDATERLGEIIGVLRDETDPAPTAPVRETIEELVTRSRAAGVDVRLAATGTGPAPVDRTAYRVVQEALTNAVKHAPGAPVTVRLAHEEAGLTVRVTNGRPRPGAPPGGAGGGRGLAGLRERVRSAGGALRAGERDGGYEVIAELPRLTDAPDRGSAGQLSELRRTARRGMAAAVAVAVSIGTAALGLLLVLRWYEVSHSFLDPAGYDSMRAGQQRGDIQLPRQQVASRPEVAEPPVPAGARCEYYRVTRDFFAGPIDVYRLCFVDGRLAGKTVVPGAAR